MSHTEIWGTGYSFTCPEWRAVSGDVCIWTRVGRDPTFDQFSSAFHWVSSERCHHRLPVSPASCWLRRHGNMLSRCEKPACGWNNTLHINTQPCGEEEKKTKTLSDHVLRSMPSSCLTGWRGQPKRKSDWGTEGTRLLLLTLILYKQNAKFILDWNDLAWIQRLKMALRSFTWEGLIGHISQKGLWGYLSGN